MDTTRPADADLPHNLEAEQALLGALLVNNDVLAVACEGLGPEHFHEAIHARIYDAAASLIRQGSTASPLTLRTYFDRDETLAEIGGPAYLARLAASATTIVNAREYGRIVLDLAQRRRLIAACEATAAAARAPMLPGGTGPLLSGHVEAITGLAEGASERRALSAEETMAETIDQAAAAYQADGRLTGVTWGLSDMDEMTGGLHGGQLVLIAGRPGQGKTTLATALARRAAQAGTGVYFVSLEMGTAELGLRLASDLTRDRGAGVEYSRLRRGRVSEEEFRRVIQAAEEIQRLPLWIDDRRGVTVADLATRARGLRARLAAQGRRLGLVVVDYLQLMRPGERYGGSRVNEVAEISAGLKGLAGTLDCAVLALSQLSREVERRDDKRPQLADLRDSGSLEQDADLVAFVYREEYYLGRAEPKASTSEHLEWQERMAQAKGVCEVIVAKQRNGPVGTRRIAVSMAHAWAGDLARDGHQPDREGDLWG